MTGNSQQVAQIIDRRMKSRGISERNRAFFLEAWSKMALPASQLDWQQLKPARASEILPLPQAGSTEYQRLHQLGRDHLGQCAIVKLNGGSSTTMGGKVPKCMVTAKDGKSFLEIVLGQVMAANDSNQIEMPLVLMNSFFTDHVSEKIVGRTPLIIRNFIQNEYPRIRVDNQLPLDTGTDADWSPAGHGDFFNSLEGSGLLDDLLELGVRYAFISNIDNLSAEVSPLILGRMVEGKHDFLMEVTAKTVADVKGGAPAYYQDRLTLLEIAQVPDAHKHEFQDIEQFTHFNTNNLWVDLQAIKQLLARDALQLPIMQNRKQIREVDIIQIETAMGAGLQCFERPGLVEVSRDRFAPVKKLSDLFLLQSDVYVMDREFRLKRNPLRTSRLAPLPTVEFGDGFPADDDLGQSFADPASISLLAADSLHVEGRVYFSRDVVIEGAVRLSNPTGPVLTVPEKSVLTHA